MIDNYEFIEALIPLRGGSKGIPKKNIKIFNGFPLFFWTAKSVREANIPLNISTDDKEIKENIKKYTPFGNIIDRPKEFAKDHSATEDVVKHFCSLNKSKHILLLQATSPLTTSIHIKNALDMYFANNCKPLLSGTFQHKFIWNNNGTPKNYNPINRPRRQDWKGEFIENGALYIFSRKDFLSSGCRCLPPCTLFEMEEIHSNEIDTLSDWNYLEFTMKKDF